MRRLKSDKFTALNKDKRDGETLEPLRFKHMTELLKGAHDASFKYEQNIRGWQIEGIIPFNRHQYWKLKLANTMKNATRSSFGSTGTYAPGMSITEMLTSSPSEARQSNTGPPTISTTETTSNALSALNNKELPDTVRDAFMRAEALSDELAASAGEDLTTARTAFITENLAMREILKTITTWSKPLFLDNVEPDGDADLDLVEEGEGAPRDGRLNLKASRLWNQSLSATGPEIIELAREQMEHRKRKAAADLKKKEAKERKAREDASDLVNLGLEALNHIAQGGGHALERLSIRHLQGLLQHANPQGKVVKGNKADLQTKAKALSSVTKALQAYESSHPPPAAPSAPAHPQEPASASTEALAPQNPTSGAPVLP